MFGIDATNNDISQMIFGLVAFFIVNVLINLFLINKLFEERKKLKNIQRTYSDPNKSIKEFLEQQCAQTRSYNRNPNNEHKLDKLVVYFRTAYMKIERNAAHHVICSPYYWQYLNEQLLKLIKATLPPALQGNKDNSHLQQQIGGLKDKLAKIPTLAKHPKAAENRDKIISFLDKVSQHNIDNPNQSRKISQKVQKIEELVQLFDNPERRRHFTLQKRQTQYIQRSKQHLDTIERNRQSNDHNIRSFQNILANSEKSDSLEQELNKFKSENNKLNIHISQLKKELKEFQARIQERETPRVMIESSADKKPATYELNDVSDEILEANEKEIDRLRDVISNQRRSILEMEESLQHLQSLTSTDNTDHQVQIEKLMRCIQESEVCISMLEQELDGLKNDLKQLREQKDDDMTLVESHQLTDELVTIKTELEAAVDHNLRYETQLRFIKECLQAESVEDVALLIYEHITQTSALPSLVIKSLDRMIELSPQGAVSARDKVLINNMQVNEANPGTRGQLIFRFLNISGIIRPPLGEELNSEEQGYLIDTIKIANLVLGRLALNIKAKAFSKQKETSINAIKQLSQELDKLVDEHAKKAKKLVANNFGELQDIARSKGLGASHIANFNSIEQETLRQLEAENTLRLKLRKKFLALLNQLED